MSMANVLVVYTSVQSLDYCLDQVGRSHVLNLRVSFN